MRTLPEALDAAARSREGFTFIADGRETITSYAQLQQRAFGVAGALADAGVRRGDLVALAIPGAEPFLTTLLGAAMAGAVPASLYPPSAGGNLSDYFRLTAGILQAVGARAVVTSAALLSGFGAVREECPGLALVLSSDDLDAPREPDFRPSLDDIAFVQFTSGSTSAPRGVTVSHRNLCANIDAINGALGTSGADSAVSWLPLAHDMGLVGMALGPLYAARPAVLMMPQAFVRRPAEWLHAISRHRATVSFAPNFAYDLAARRVKDRDLDGIDLSCWRVAGCGAEPIHASSLAAFARRFEAVGFRASSFLPCYGLAEHVLAATFPPRGREARVDDAGAGAVVSCGRPLPDHQIRIVTESGEPAAEGEVGEIALAGPSVMRGYYGDPAATAQAIRDGWLYTGDLGYLSDGELFVCGRARDLIIVNGRKYHPQDLESAVCEATGIGRGRVVAFGSSTGASAERVIIVVEGSGAAQPDALRLPIRRRIGDLFGLYVDEIVFAPAGTIRRTTSGKVRRGATRAAYERGDLGGGRAAAPQCSMP